MFPVLVENDPDNSLVDEEYLIEDDMTRFMVARDGDHLMTPFQCEKCHSSTFRAEQEIWCAQLMISCPYALDGPLLICFGQGKDI